LTLAQRPFDVFAQQRAGLGQPRAQRRFDLRIGHRAQRIAQRHRQVAQPALVADAPDRAAFGAAQELGLVPGPQLQQRGAFQRRTRVEVGQRRRFRILVPRAHQLAVVAAVDAVAQRRAQFLGDGAVVLDGQVRDAAPRVQPVGCDDGARRAHLDARAAAAAVRGRGLGGRQCQVDEDLAEEEHRAGVALQRQRVLAAPAGAAARGQLHLEHRRRIGEHARAQRADFGGEPVGQLLQPRAQHLVVVAAAGVDRHAGLPGIAQPLPFDRLPARRGGARQVVQPRGDHAERARHQLGRARALQAVALHVVHRTVVALRQPGAQAGLGAAQVDSGHTDL